MALPAFDARAIEICAIKSHPMVESFNFMIALRTRYVELMWIWKPIYMKADWCTYIVGVSQGMVMRTSRLLEDASDGGRVYPKRWVSLLRLSAY